jgi:hypothetical protein
MMLENYKQTLKDMWNTKSTLLSKSYSIKNLFAKTIIIASICVSSIALSTTSSAYIPARNSNINNNNNNNTNNNNNSGLSITDTILVKKDTVSAKNYALADLSFNPKSLDSMIASYAHVDNNFFSDNEYYRMLRQNDALSQMKKYDIQAESIVLIVNKTFQKAMLVKFEVQPYIYSKDSLDSFVRQGRDVKISKNIPDKLVEMVLEPTILSETDCSTAKVYGSKEFDGDAKTPEGMLTIYSIEDSHDWTYDGLLAFGPDFLRIKNAIGIHGNGTDTTRIKDWKSNPHYSPGGPLGLYANNFGYGLSHGCIRLDNSVIDTLVKNDMLKNGTRVIIFENKELTEKLSRYYNASMQANL